MFASNKNLRGAMLLVSVTGLSVSGAFHHNHIATALSVAVILFAARYELIRDNSMSLYSWCLDSSVVTKPTLTIDNARWSVTFTNIVAVVLSIITFVSLVSNTVCDSVYSLVWVGLVGHFCTWLVLLTYAFDTLNYDLEY